MNGAKTNSELRDSLIIFATGLITAIWPLAAPDALPLKDFITYTCYLTRITYNTLQVTIFYVVLLHVVSLQTSPQGFTFPPCGQYIFLSAFRLAWKFLHDSSFSTRKLRELVGSHTAEMNSYELGFSQAVGWNLYISMHKFQRWSHAVYILSQCGYCFRPACRPSLAELLGWNVVLPQLACVIIYGSDVIPWINVTRTLTLSPFRGRKGLTERENHVGETHVDSLHANHHNPTRAAGPDDKLDGA